MQVLAENGILLNRKGRRANFREKGGRHMFDTPETRGEESGTGKWIGIAVAVAIVIGAVVFFMGRKNGAQNAAPAAATTAAPAQANADAVKDLRVVSAKMDKDSSGATMWSVELRNLSQVYAYSAITYQTDYMGADNGVIATNHGTIPSVSLDPGESQSTQFRDTLFPTGTVWFKFKVTGASAAK